MRQRARGALVVTLLLACSLSGAGCGDDSAGPDRPAGLTEPDQVVAAFALQWQLKNLQALDDLLAPDFRFHLRDDDVGDFPWLTTPWWGRTEELACAANMFDPNFQGGDPPVQSIEFEYNVIGSSELQPGTHEITADAVITVLTGPADGWSSDTRFLFRMEEQPDGSLLLSEMTEVLKVDPLRGTPAAVEQSTWAQVKALYRGIPVDLSDPAAVVVSLAMAWEARNGETLAALLAPDFAFFIRDDNADDFPWMSGPSWDRDTELAFAAHMFDPAYVGESPPVQSIQFEYAVLAASELQPGEHELVVDAILTVLTGPADGWISDTRFVLRITEQPDGFLRFREMREVLKLDPARGASSSVESSTWGQIKGLYR